MFGHSQRRGSGHEPEQALAVTIAPTSGSKILQFKLHKGNIIALGITAGILFLAGIVAVVLYGHLVQEASAAKSLRNENAQLRRQLTRMAELEAQVERMEATRRALLRIVGANLPEDDLSLGAEMDIGTTPYPTDSYRSVEPGGTLSEEDLEELGHVLRVLPLQGPRTREFGPLGDTGVFHTGIDVAGQTGAPIHTAGEGITSFVGVHEAFGWVVVISHRPGIETMYGHNSQILVKVGDYVTAGQTIAEVGNTGHSTAPHLHFEVHLRGAAVNPALVIPAWRARQREQDSSSG